MVAALVLECRAEIPSAVCITVIYRTGSLPPRSDEILAAPNIPTDAVPRPTLTLCSTNTLGSTCDPLTVPVPTRSGDRSPSSTLSSEAPAPSVRLTSTDQSGSADAAGPLLFGSSTGRPDGCSTRSSRFWRCRTASRDQTHRLTPAPSAVGGRTANVVASRRCAARAAAAREPRDCYGEFAVRDRCRPCGVPALVLGCRPTFAVLRRRPQREFRSFPLEPALHHPV